MNKPSHKGEACENDREGYQMPLKEYLCDLILGQYAVFQDHRQPLARRRAVCECLPRHGAGNEVAKALNGMGVKYVRIVYP